MEEGAEKQTKGMVNLFNEILVENSPNLCNNIHIYVQKAFQNSINLGFLLQRLISGNKFSALPSLCFIVL
jgi:hypothetical protein